MGEPGGHYDKWNRPDIEGQIPQALSYMWESLKVEFPKKQKAEWWLPGQGWEEEEEMLVKGYNNFRNKTSRHLLFNMVTIVNKSVLYYWKTFKWRMGGDMMIKSTEKYF